MRPDKPSTIKIKVYPGPLCTADRLDEDGFILVEDGTTVGDLLRQIGCPKTVESFGLFMVNHKPAKTGLKLSDGDILSVIAPVAGGRSKFQT